MQSKLAGILLATALITALAATGNAQEPKQEQTQKPRATKVAPKSAETDEKTEPEPAQPSQEEMMRRTLDDLSAQINQLTTEVQKLRQENARNSEVMQLLLSEDRLAKVEEKIQEAIDYKMQLDAREADIQRRSRNIQQEVTMRGGLRRDEAEQAIRAEFQRVLEEIHTQQSNYQQRIAELQAQAARLRARVETLRKKVERTEEQ